ncbi:uncharacterized protein LOC129302084 [Prosopis cineraria]|uniref:uncharacterized protein LOC129302084 n=1 Tax=Prosopis cineraria TaxID=364024 RepID=UPI00240FEA47|nr:uncharacterized protein LOC129302084 [Prosopis cineraria]
MNSNKGKAVWNSNLTEIFIKECLEQVYKKQRKETAFNKNGWQAIIKGFEAKTGKRYKGLRCTRELTLIFRDVLATEEILFVPFATQTQIEDDDDDDMYHPTIDLQKGSGDIEEELNLSNTASPMGVTDELLGLNVTTNTGRTSGDKSQGKRKRVVGIGGRKKQKVTASMKIADAISKIAKDNRARIETVNKILVNDIGVFEVVAHLNILLDVFGDKDLHWRCVNLVLYKPMRDAYW